MIFRCCERLVIFLSFRNFSPSSLCFVLSFNFLLFHLYTFLNNYCILLNKLHLKFCILSFCFVRICLLKSFVFVKTVLNPYLLATLFSFSATPFSYGMNIFNSSRSLLLCSQLRLCKVSLTVLLITFNSQLSAAGLFKYL